AVTSDQRFICPTRAQLRASAMGQPDPLPWRYHFAHALDNAPLAIRAEGAFHGLELRFVFHNLNTGGYVPSAAETTLADQMVGYWTRFAASGDPNGGGSPMWPRYDGSDPAIVLDDPLSTRAGIRTAQCDFWQQHLP